MSVEPLSPTQAGGLFRRKPIGDRHGPQLNRTMGTFQLMMFGVGATVGTGIFFVLSSAVPEAGPAVGSASDAFGIWGGCCHPGPRSE